MNYRHSFHAGNFADVVKHAVLVRILLHLREKPAPFRVIDTHAGAGLYDLNGPDAGRSLEWREGIARLLGAFSGKKPALGLDPRVDAGFPQNMRPTRETTAPIGEGARALLAPYLDAVAAINAADQLATYPGSPALVRAFLRAQDRLVACELEPNAAAALARYLGGDRRSKAVAIDGWTALNAYVPPKERRGLVLIDPPFEDAGDFPRLAHALEAAHRKWASGIYLLWYPIKERAAPDALARRLLRSRMAKTGMTKILRAELSVGTPQSRGDPSSANKSRDYPSSASNTRDPDRLGACGLIVVNPPWTLAGELEVMLPDLAATLSGAGGGGHRVDWLAGEK
jgi:23S rRNA (adenine2030-N6)-methyltransferase